MTYQDHCRHPHPGIPRCHYSLRGSNPRPMAHKTIALTTELRELLETNAHVNPKTYAVRGQPHGRELGAYMSNPNNRNLMYGQVLRARARRAA